MTTTTTEPTTTYETGTIAHVSPSALLLERNIRDAQPDQALIDSVGEVGVLEPITAVLVDDGRILVRFGHRRTLAAIAAGLDVVPVYVTADTLTGTSADIHRVITQHDENTHRAGLTAADEVHVVEQLVAFGLSADDISAQARIAADRVDTALTVSRSKLASKTAVKYSELSLDQAAAIAEFDDDTEAAKALIVCAIDDPEDFAHTLQQTRDNRARAVAHAAALQLLADAGVKVIEEPYYDSKVKATRLDYLVDAKGKTITETAHATCPGHVAWVRTVMAWSKAADGGDLRTPRADVTYGCLNPTKNGHKDRYGGSSASTTAAANMTDAEREKAKAERRLVIDNNKAWTSAEVVRRDWLREFAQRKTPPKGAAAFIAQTLAGERAWLSDYRVPAIVVELLGGTSSSNLDTHVAKLLKGATENRAQVIALAQILAAVEAMTSTQTWRTDGAKSLGGRYLRFLESAGYTLSDVEKYACSSKTV